MLQLSPRNPTIVPTQTSFKPSIPQNSQRIGNEISIIHKPFKLTVDLAEKLESFNYEPYFSEFKTLFRRLEDEYAIRRFVSPSDITEVIQVVIDLPATRKLIFEKIQEASEACDREDCYERPLSIFNTIQGLAWFGRREAEGANRHELLEIAKSIARQTLLDESTHVVIMYRWNDGRIGCNTRSTGPDVSEALTFQMDLRRALGKELALPFLIPIPTDQPNYIEDRVSKIPAKDLAIARNYVVDAMGNENRLVEVLISQPVWKQYIERSCEKERAEIDNDFRKRLGQYEEENKMNPRKEQAHLTRADDLLKAHRQKKDMLLQDATRRLCNQWEGFCTLF